MAEELMTYQFLFSSSKLIYKNIIKSALSVFNL